MSGTRLRGLDPVMDSNIRVLILGSMPGVQSLNAVEYYAHPRNALWWILSEWLEFDLQQPYLERCQGILDAGLGLWDVVGECVRPGSLDSAIRLDSVVVNDILGLLVRYQQIERILFNGGKAASLFNKHVAASLRDLGRDVASIVLPSTSPAYAAMSQEEKKARWIRALS